MSHRPVVGREELLAGLRTELEAARAGAGRLIVLSGPAGIGKTALAQELSAMASAEGVPVVRGRCLDDDGAPPLWPWTQVLTRSGGDLGPAAQAGPDSAAARFLLVDGLVQQLIASAEPGGRVVVLEDLHWADETSLQALRHLAGELDTSRLLVVAAVRSPWPEHVAAAVDDALRHPGGRLIEVPPLGAAAIGAYLTARMGAAIDPALADEVHRRTGGTPLLVSAAAGVLASAPDGSGGTGPVHGTDLWAQVAAATDVGRLATRMLLTLDPEARETIRLAAVLGERIDVPRLIAIRPHAPLAQELRAATGAGLLAEDPGESGYRFTHALVRDAIVSSIDPVRRAELHELAAEDLAAQADSDPSVTIAWAGHLLRSAPDEHPHADLIRAASAAARESDRRLGYEDAARWWGIAVEAATRSGADDERLGRLLIELAQAQFQCGRYGDSLAVCERAAGLALRLDRGDLLAEAAVVIEGLGMPQAIAPIAAWCEQALDLLGRDAEADRSVDDALLARLLAQHAWALMERGRTEESEAASARALELATASGDPTAVLAAVHARSNARWQADAVSEQLQLGQTAIRVGTAAGRPISVVLGHIWRCNAAHQIGNLDAGQAEMDAVGRIAESTRLPLIRWHHLRMRAARAGMEGRFEEGLALSEQAFDMMVDSGDASATGMTGAYLQFVATITGRSELLEDGRFDRIFKAAPPLLILQAAGVLASITRGRMDEAQARYAVVRPQLFAPHRDSRWLGVLVYLLDVVDALDDAGAARVVLAELEPWEGLPGALGVTTVVYRGSLDRDLGRMAAVAGDLDRAERLLRHAIEANIRLGARPFVVCARIELAEVLTRAGGSDAEITELLRRAAREARSLGMPSWVRRADQALAGREAAARQSERAADPLTAREHEVAALVARALSNREIAGELVLSERTVESHVRSILNKLGFSSRTEIATWAVSTRS